MKKSLITVLNFTNDSYSFSAKAMIPHLTPWDAMDFTEFFINNLTPLRFEIQYFS